MYVLLYEESRGNYGNFQILKKFTIILTFVKLILEFVKVLIYLLSKFSMFIQDMKTLPI